MLRWRERDQIRQIKEPDRRHIPEIRRDSATPSWRIRAARSPNDFFNGLLDAFEHKAKAEEKAGKRSVLKKAWSWLKEKRSKPSSKDYEKL